MVQLDLVQPAALFGLFLLPLFVLIQRASRSHLPLERQRLALALRLLAVALLVLAAAGPRLIHTADRLAVAFLLDYSDSVSPEARNQAVTWVRQALAGMRPQDQATVIVFGTHAQIEQPLGHLRDLPPISSVVDGSHTNIAEAVRLGLASLPPDAARRIVVLSDGNENVERAADQARLLASADVPIAVVPLNTSTGPEVLVRQLETPSFIREGETYTATVTIESNIATNARLHLLSDNRVLSEQDVELEPGVNTIKLAQQPLPPGFHLFELRLEAEQDTFPENNEAGSYTVVAGKPRVLVIEGEPGESRFLTDALNASGLRVDVRAPGEAPLDMAGLRAYESVVLVNVPASKLSTAQMQAIQTYVQNLGGGLVVVGGDKSYGVGRYNRTPLEDALPVKMDLRGKTLTASVALVLIIDASGSMAGGPGASKMDLAKEAAIRATELLSDQDQIGVISFDDTPRWVVEMQNVTDLASVQAAIGSISPGGGTAIYPALETAYDALVQREAKVKHAILLTDGLSTGGDYDLLVSRMRAQNITLSTIAVGSDADFQLLRRLADTGRGRYYEGNDPFDLPQLVVKETQEVARAAIVEEPFKPTQVGVSPLLDGFNPADMPPLQGYVSTTPKAASQVLLATRQGDPLLAEWQYGLGHVVVWTSDAKNRWAQDWVSWPDFSRFWAAVVKRTIPSPVDRNNQVTVTPADDGVRISVDSLTDDQHYVNFLTTSATLVTPDQQQLEVRLPQVAPGRYEAQVSASQEGPYFLNILQSTSDGQLQTSRPAGFVISYSSEYRTLRPNPELLEELARISGGRQLAEPAEAFDHTTARAGSPRELWPALVLLSILLFFLDIAVRRLRLAVGDLGAAFGRVLSRLLGRAQSAVAPAQARLLAAKNRLVLDSPPIALRRSPSVVARTVSREEPAAPAGATARPTSSAALSSRLLEAKRRARPR